MKRCSFGWHKYSEIFAEEVHPMAGPKFEGVYYPHCKPIAQKCVLCNKIRYELT